MTIHAMKGSKGYVVEKIQRRLNLVVPGAAVTPDGDFGNLTEAAVVAFQKQLALEPDGIVGDFTNAVLFGEAFVKTHRTPAEVSQSNTTMCWAAATSSLAHHPSGAAKLHPGADQGRHDRGGRCPFRRRAAHP